MKVTMEKERRKATELREKDKQARKEGNK